MVLPPPAAGDRPPLGPSYGGLLVRADRDRLIGVLGEARFTGWVGPQEAEWVCAVPAAVEGAVAGRGRGLEALGEEVAARLGTLALAADVEQDRRLRLLVADGETVVGRYDSAPPPSDEGSAPVDPDLLALGFVPGSGDEGPSGAEYAEAIAAAFGRPEAGERLAGLLADTLAEGDEIESERLGAVLGLLGLPRWLVAADVLPRSVPSGPRAEEFTRLGAGRPGAAGMLKGWAAALPRRRRR